MPSIEEFQDESINKVRELLRCNAPLDPTSSPIIREIIEHFSKLFPETIPNSDRYKHYKNLLRISTLF